jgi:hypothetical protein
MSNHGSALAGRMSRAVEPRTLPFGLRYAF